MSLQETPPSKLFYNLCNTLRHKIDDVNYRTCWKLKEENYWTEHHLVDGRSYFYNVVTCQSTLAVPEMLDWLKSNIDRLLVTCPWRERKDVGSGKSYYYNMETRESVWKVPLELAELWDMQGLCDFLEYSRKDRQHSQKLWAQQNARLRKLEEENRTLKESLNTSEKEIEKLKAASKKEKEKHNGEIEKLKADSTKEKEKYLEEKSKLEKELRDIKKRLEKAEADLDSKKSSNADNTGCGSGTDSPSSEDKDYTPEQEEAVQRVRNCKDFYEILGTTRSSSESELKKAYRKLSLQLHPDKNKAPGATEAFKALGSAFDILSNAAKKQDYDTYLYFGTKFTDIANFFSTHQSECRK